MDESDLTFMILLEERLNIVLEFLQSVLRGSCWNRKILNAFFLQYCCPFIGKLVNCLFYHVQTLLLSSYPWYGFIPCSISSPGKKWIKIEKKPF